MSPDLSGLEIWITRPESQAKVWSKQLEALGAKTLIEPMLDIQAVDNHSDIQSIKNRLLSLDEYQKAIFVSQNAVEFGTKWIDQYWPQLPIDLSFFAIGSSTAHLLEKKLVETDVTVSRPQQSMNSEDLLSLRGLKDIEGQKILIFRGKGGRTHLAEALEARGALVDYCELYKRISPKNSDQKKIVGFKNSKLVPVLAVHSGETLENLHSIIDDQTIEWLKQQALLLPGKRVAAIAKALGFSQIIIANNATHESMIGALHDWRQR